MATNDVSFLKFSAPTTQSDVSSKSAGPAENEDISIPVGQDDAAQKKAKIKADVLKQLQATPVTYGMEQPAASSASGVSIPIGQPSTQTVDRFSAAGLADAIEGYDEVSNDADVKNAFNSSKWNPANWFKGAEKTSSGEKVTDAGLPTLTKADLEKMDKTDAEIAAFLKSSGAPNIQGSSSDAKSVSTEERSASMTEMNNIATESQNLVKTLSDPNISDTQRAEATKKLEELQTKAAKILESMKPAESDKPELNPETQAKVDGLSPKDQADTQAYLQTALGKGADTDDKGYKELSPASQGAVTAMAGDLKAKHPDMD